jgi:hypothetical protein
MAAAENIERQVAIAVVIAVKEPPLLIAVQRIVGRIEVEHDLTRRLGVRVEKQFDKQPLDRRAIVADLVIARPLARARRMLQPVQCALARQRRRLIAIALELAQKHAQNRIATQVVVVVEVLITERQAEHPLPDQSLERMHGEERAAMIAEARGKSIDEADRLVRLAQQQSPRVRGHQPAVEIRHNPPPASPSKLHLCRATLRQHRSPLRISVTR